MGEAMLISIQCLALRDKQAWDSLSYDISWAIKAMKSQQTVSADDPHLP